MLIEHVDAIVDMRRGLVLNESRFPDELKVTFSNLERNFTPWNFSHSTRADWAQGFDVPVMADVRNRGRLESLFEEFMLEDAEYAVIAETLQSRPEASQAAPRADASGWSGSMTLASWR